MAAHFGAADAPFLIAGPCVVESDDLNLRVGEALAQIARRLGLAVIYKASYDKANRSRLDAERGPGMDVEPCEPERSQHEPDQQRVRIDFRIRCVTPLADVFEGRFLRWFSRRPGR